MSDEEPPSETRKHRPGDREWLEPAVVDLHSALMMGKPSPPSEPEYRALIYQALVAAGHSGVVTNDKIWHILAPHPPKPRRRRVH